MKSFNSRIKNYISDITRILNDVNDYRKKIDQIGETERKIGNIYILKPVIEFCKAISISVFQEKIVSVSMELVTKIKVSELSEILNCKPEFRENIYDEETVISFRVENYILSTSFKKEPVSNKTDESKFNDLYISLININTI